MVLNNTNITYQKEVSIIEKLNLFFSSSSLYKIAGGYLIGDEVIISAVRKLNLKVTNCIFYDSLNKYIFISKDSNKVLRISKNEQGIRDLKKNAYALKKFKQSDACELLSISRERNVLITEETYIDDSVKLEIVSSIRKDVESRKSIQNIYSQNLKVYSTSFLREFDLVEKYVPDTTSAITKDLLSSLRQLLEGKVSDLYKQVKLMKTIIHGDLTFRNMLRKDGVVVLFDWDRVCFSLPEMDFILLELDFKTHRSGNPNYGLFSDIISQHFLDQDENRNLSESIYNMFTFSIANKPHFKNIYLLFILRITVSLLPFVPQEDMNFMLNKLINNFDEDVF